MTKSRGILRSRRFWTEPELELLRCNYADSRTEDIATAICRPVSSVYQKADALGLRKSDEYLASPAACRLRRGDNVGQAHRFEKGAAPWNKGSHYVAGGRSAETRFKPGSRPHTWAPVGTYRINADGYLDQKVSDTGYPPRDWVGVHRLVWIDANGPILAGHVVSFKPGRRTTDAAAITLDALEMISRGELARRNHFRNYGPEFAKVVQLRGAITRQINKRLKETA
jgi:hypothetical protein